MADTENIVIKDPLGRSITYGEYDNILVTSSNGNKLNYSKLPEVTDEDNGKVLGVIDGIWNKMEAEFSSGGSSQTGTIEYEETIAEWNTATTPTVTFDISAFGMTAYKLSDATPTKEQMLAAKWSLSDSAGENVYDITLSETSDIAIDTEANIMINLSVSPQSTYVVSYETGEHLVSYSGVDTTINVPETGIYQVYTSDSELPNTIFGSITYTVFDTVDFVQSDWEQNDTTQPDYIKNRPFYSIETTETTEFFAERSLEFYAGDPAFYICNDIYLDSNATTFTEMKFTEALVNWDGTQYSCQAQDVEGMICIGNVSLLTEGIDNGNPFIYILTNFGGDSPEYYEAIYSIYDADKVTQLFGGDVTFSAQSDSNRYVATIDLISFVEGDQYYIEYNNSSYDAMVANSYSNGYYIGNGSLIDSSLENTNYSFVIYTTIENDEEVTTILSTNVVGTAPVAIYHAPLQTHSIGIDLMISEKEIQKIDSKYIDIDWSLINNKPFGIEPIGTIVVNEDIIMPEPDGFTSYTLTSFDKGLITEGANYIMKINGVSYLGSSNIDLAYKRLLFEDNNGTLMAGIVYSVPDDTAVFASFITDLTVGETYKLTITTDSEIIRKLDASYIPDDIGVLPSVTTSNNGQVLTVVSGEWKAKSITHPTELPSVSSSYNGKILGVVNGSWATMDAPSSVPEVTTDDNGKILTVVDSVWTAQEITHPTELPSVTADDVGKFLRVSSDGIWIAETIQNAEEVLF